jgi:hypothetical protein
MTSLLTINHYIDQVNNFIDGVRQSNGGYYVFAARPNPWLAADGTVDETNVGSVDNSVAQIELDTFNELIFGKAVSNSDVAHVIPKKVWTANTVYAQYDQNDPNLYTKDFYVLTTPAYGVYKCIFNNSGANSTVMPTLVLTDGPFETGDGYVWKYMYTVDPTANAKFTSASFIPVTANAEVQGNATPGTIDVINISNGGLGYAVYETGTVQAVVDRNTIKISNTSSSTNGYYNRSSIYLKSGYGAGQIREISGYNGVAKTLTIAAPIDVYTRLDLTNTSFTVGGGSVGETVRQVVDTIATSNTIGYFSSGSNVQQTDTGITALVLTANASSLKVYRYNTATLFDSRLPIRDTSDTGILRSTTSEKKVNVSNSSALFSSVVLTSGSGYTSNATVTITSNSGSGAVANASANGSGKITAILLSSNGTGYLSEPLVTVSPPSAQAFNGNSAVTEGTGAGANNIIQLGAAAARFVAADIVTYTVSPGSNAVGGLTSGSQYYIQFANSSHVALSLTSNTNPLNRIVLTKGSSDTGHSLRGQTATGRIFPRNLVAVNTASGTSGFTTDFPLNSYIRVGQNANNNIRRVAFVNSTSIAVDIPFILSEDGVNTFSMSTVTEPLTISVATATSTVSNSTVDIRQLDISNFVVNGASFIVGERVQAVNDSNTALGANGTVAFTNNSVLVISGALGAWPAGEKVRGLTSLQRADIDAVTQTPSVTVTNPSGQFLIGFPVAFSDTAGTSTGTAVIYDTVNLISGSMDYEIGPTVKITGDGEGATAVAEVDTFTGAVSGITMITPGNNYTEASIEIYANTLYGNGASATATISPLLGHGADPVTELGARYAAITTKFDTLINESYLLPSVTSYRKVGIIKDPVFANAAITLQNFNVVNLTLSNTSGAWTNGEVVVQESTNAAGVVITGNNTSLTLRDTIGEFIQSTNTSLKVEGYSSGAAANVSVVSILRFANGDVITQDGTGATAAVVGGNNTTIQVSNIVGRFANGLAIASPNTNARAVVNSISVRAGTRNVTTSYGLRFNQTGRLTLGPNTAAFSDFEVITQGTTRARAKVLSGTSDLDLTVTPVSISPFALGDVVTNQATSANGTVIFANNTFVRLTAVSNVQQFSVGNRINSISANADIANVHSVLVVYDVSKSNQFAVGANPITGSSSGAVATCIGITNPDLIRESGKVIYTESSNTVIDRDQGTTEEIRLVIKF